jgi:hypothetical protein
VVQTPVKNLGVRRESRDRHDGVRKSPVAAHHGRQLVQLARRKRHAAGLHYILVQPAQRSRQLFRHLQEFQNFVCVGIFFRIRMRDNIYSMDATLPPYQER